MYSLTRYPMNLYFKLQPTTSIYKIKKRRKKRRKLIIRSYIKLKINYIFNAKKGITFIEFNRSHKYDTYCHTIRPLYDEEKTAMRLFVYKHKGFQIKNDLITW